MLTGLYSYMTDREREMWKLWWVIWNETQSGHRCSADHNLHKTSHFVTFDFSLKLIIGRSSNNTGKSCHYIKSTRGQLVFKMNFTGISCYLINHLNLTIWGLNKAQCQCWLLGTPNKEPRGGRGLLLHLPPLVCHWANITHHISVRICQFLPLCFMLQSPTDLSVSEEKPGLGSLGVEAESSSCTC